MKVLIFLVLLAVAFTAKSGLTPAEEKNLMDFGLGVMMGLNITDRVPDLLNCAFNNET